MFNLVLPIFYTSLVEIFFVFSSFENLVVVMSLISVVNYGTTLLLFKSVTNSLSWLVNSKSVEVICFMSSSISSNCQNVSTASFKFIFCCLGARYVKTNGVLFQIPDIGRLHSTSSFPVFFSLLVTTNNGVACVRLTCLASHFSLSSRKLSKACPNLPHALHVCSFNLDNKGHLFVKCLGSLHVKKMVLLNSIIWRCPLVLPPNPPPPLYHCSYLSFAGEVSGEEDVK